MLKILEWIGYIICLGSVIANGFIRNNGTFDSHWESYTFFSIFAGGIITIVAFLFRRFRSEKVKNGKSL